jgi:hypothetical protein
MDHKFIPLSEQVKQIVWEKEDINKPLERPAIDRKYNNLDNDQRRSYARIIANYINHRCGETIKEMILDYKPSLFNDEVLYEKDNSNNLHIANIVQMHCLTDCMGDWTEYFCSNTIFHVSLGHSYCFECRTHLDGIGMISAVHRVSRDEAILLIEKFLLDSFYKDEPNQERTHTIVGWAIWYADR